MYMLTLQKVHSLHMSHYMVSEVQVYIIRQYMVYSSNPHRAVHDMMLFLLETQT